MKKIIYFILMLRFTLTALSQEKITGFVYNDIGAVFEANIVLDEVVVNAYGNTKKTYVIRCYGNATQVCTCCCNVEGLTIEEESSDKKNIKPVLYPNPSNNGLFKLKLPSNYNKAQIQVSNISGQLIKTSNHRQVNKEVNIDLSYFPIGIYIINVTSNGKLVTTKKAVIGQ